MIELHNVTLDIPTYTSVADLDLRRTVAQSLLGSRLFKGRRGGVFVRPLENVSLKVKDGERLGIIGHNGAGKTTLMKTIAGIYPPQSGRVVVNGHVRSFFNLGAGLDPLRTGRDNIELVSLYYTRNIKTIRKAAPEIIEFSELGHFIDLPVSTYSSGMLTRLLFSIVTAYPAEILLLDEMLGAGDASFVAKAQARANSMVDKAGCVVIASHSAGMIREMCHTAVWLERGRVVAHGPADEVVDQYTDSVMSRRPVLAPTTVAAE